MTGFIQRVQIAFIPTEEQRNILRDARNAGYPIPQSNYALPAVMGCLLATGPSLYSLSSEFPGRTKVVAKVISGTLFVGSSAAVAVLTNCYIDRENEEFNEAKRFLGRYDS